MTELPIPSDKRSAVRQASKNLFGHKYFLETVVALNQVRDGRAYLRELASDTAIPDASLRAPLGRLSELGFIRSLGAARGALPRVYERLPAPIWGFAEAVLDDLLDQSPSTDGEQRLSR